MISTIVLDDEWYNLEEICTLAEHTGFMQVVGRYMNPLMALEEASRLKPQVALIDIEMPEMDGMTFAERLVEQNPGVLFAFITSWNQYAVRAFELNALDYVMKPIKVERFEKTADKMRQELERNARSSYAQRILPLWNVQEKETSGVKNIQPLSPREMEVLVLLSQGLTQKEMAERLYLSVSSIKTHLAGIYSKLSVNNKISAVQKAREARIL